MSMFALSLSPFFTQRNLRPRHDQRDRNKELVVLHPEVQRLQIDRNIGRGQIAAHLLRQSLLAVLGLLVLEVRRRIVSGPVLHLHIAAVQLHRQMPIASIPRRIGRVEPKDVVSLRIMLDLLKRRGKIIRVEECFAAGILRQRRQRLLRAEVRIQIALHRPAAIGRSPAQASRRSIAHRRQRLQPARIDAIDRHIRLHRFIRRRAHARLVLDALPRQPPLKYNRLFL